jgi:small nuclear ribonucleoprotein (snRNP)-like protein
MKKNRVPESPVAVSEVIVIIHRLNMVLKGERRVVLMKRGTMINFFAVLLLVFVFILSPLLSTRADAENKPVNSESIGYNVISSMAENLKALTGKVVYISLDSGKTYTGIVKAVGDHLVHVEKLEGKEYFDALISIESIRAIDTRFREFQR